VPLLLIAKRIAALDDFREVNEDTGGDAQIFAEIMFERRDLDANSVTPQTARDESEIAVAGHEDNCLRAKFHGQFHGFGCHHHVHVGFVSLCCRWPALLADEPAASLDIRHRIDVVQALVARARDRLSVVVMHDLDLTFRFFDKVIVMDAGRIVAHGRAQDIFDDERLDAAFGVKFERLTTARDRLLRAI